MASPQKENGFTPIANELLDALARTRIPGEARQVLDVIIRQTYGWQRKTVQISYRRFSELTGLQNGHIYRGIRSLVDHLIVVISADGFSVQKNYDLWLPYSKRGYSESGVLPKGILRKGIKTYSQSGVGPTPKKEYETPGIGNEFAGLEAPKERFKEIKEISLSTQRLSLPERESICKDLKRFFPTLTVPDVVPTERAYLFLAKLRFGEISKDEIRSPPAFLIAMRDEDITPYLEREEKIRERQRIAQEAASQAPEIPVDREAAQKFFRSLREKGVTV